MIAILKKKWYENCDKLNISGADSFLRVREFEIRPILELPRVRRERRLADRSCTSSGPTNRIYLSRPADIFYERFVSREILALLVCHTILTPYFSAIFFLSPSPFFSIRIHSHFRFNSGKYKPYGWANGRRNRNIRDGLIWRVISRLSAESCAREEAWAKKMAGSARVDRTRFKGREDWRAPSFVCKICRLCRS